MVGLRWGYLQNKTSCTNFVFVLNKINKKLDDFVKNEKVPQRAAQPASLRKRGLLLQ